MVLKEYIISTVDLKMQISLLSCSNSLINFFKSCHVFCHNTLVLIVLTINCNQLVVKVLEVRKKYFVKHFINRI